MKRKLGILITIFCLSLVASQPVFAADSADDYQANNNIEGESVKIEGLLSPINERNLITVIILNQR